MDLVAPPNLKGPQPLQAHIDWIYMRSPLAFGGEKTSILHGAYLILSLSRQDALSAWKSPSLKFAPNRPVFDKFVFGTRMEEKSQLYFGHFLNPPNRLEKG